MRVCVRTGVLTCQMVVTAAGVEIEWRRRTLPPRRRMIERRARRRAPIHFVGYYVRGMIDIPLTGARLRAKCGASALRG